MFFKGQRVQLTQSLGPFGPGAQGIVQLVQGELIVVHIDRNQAGKTIAPPFPEPPVRGTQFYRPV